MMIKLLKFMILTLIFQCVYAVDEHVVRGQRYFFQYCSGCHSLSYAPISLASQTPSPWQQALQKGVWVTNLSEQDAQTWFGRVPPDLSLIGLQHSKSWIKDYLNGFYFDTKHPLGRNNRVLSNVLMPDVLLGAPEPRRVLVRDITAFLMDVAEPEKVGRHLLGLWVMLLCGMGLVVTWCLRKLYQSPPKNGSP